MRQWLAVIALTGLLMMVGSRGAGAGEIPDHSADVGDSR